MSPGDESDLATPHSKKKVKKRKIRDVEGGGKSKKPRKKKGKKVQEELPADDTYFDVSFNLQEAMQVLLNKKLPNYSLYVGFVKFLWCCYSNV